jgi:CAAX protease family protein
MQAAAAAPQIAGIPEKKPVAPLWHTVILIAFFLVPFTWWPGVPHLISLMRGSHKLFAYILELELQWLLVLFTCIGLFVRNIRLRDVVGSVWKNEEDVRHDIGIGLSFALLSVGVAIGLYTLLGDFSSRPSNMRFIPSTFAQLLVYLMIMMSAGISEELMFRGYLQLQIERLTGSFRTAVYVQAIIFAAAHGYDQTFAGYFDKFVFALLMSYLAWRYKSLLPGIVAHACMDCGLVLIAWLANQV